MRSQILERVERVYQWLDGQLRQAEGLAGTCEGCGKCCDFEAFDHRLFVTPPELMYLAANLGGEKPRAMTTGRCPYNIGGKCMVYDYRFAGCRVFCCKGDKDLQSRLSKFVLTEFRAICNEFNIRYRYTDLPASLKSLAGD